MRGRTGIRTGILLPLFLIWALWGCDNVALKAFIVARAGGLYVSVEAGASGNPGTKDLPMKDIRTAVDYLRDQNGRGSIYVAKGTYQVKYDEGDYILLSDGIALHGGYSLDFGVRDPAANQTVITDLSTTGGTEELSPNRTIEVEAGSTAATVIDGFVIQGGGGERSAAVFCSGASPTISNNWIDGGSGSARSFGIVSLDGSSPHICGNEEIRGGSSAGTSIAVWNNGSSPHILSNHIHGGESYRTAAIVNEAGSEALINANTIYGGTASGTQATGIQDLSSSSRMWNNVIFGGKVTVVEAGRNAYGIICIFDGESQIYNNTLCSGVGFNSWAVLVSAGTSMGGSAPGPAPEIRNNIIFTRPGAGRYCIYEDIDNGRYVGSIRNNDLWDYDGASTTLYHSHTGDDYDTVAAIEALAPALDAGANAEVDPVFVDEGGVDGDLTTLGDNDWRLSAASTVKYIGLDLSTVSTEYLTEDRDGKSRSGNGSIGWSMGAYEY